MKLLSLMKWNWPDTGLMLVSWFFYFHNKFLKIFEQNIGKLSKLLEKYFSWKMASWSLLSSMSSSKPRIRHILWLFDRCWRLLQKGFISKYSVAAVLILGSTMGHSLWPLILTSNQRHCASELKTINQRNVVMIFIAILIEISKVGYPIHSP